MTERGEMMANFIVAAVLVMISGAAIIYIIKEKKKGTACIGCPNAGTCAGKRKEHSGYSCH